MTNTPTLLPERIWIGDRAKYLLDEEGSCLCYSRPEIGGIEYVRADLASAIAGVPAPDLSHFLIIEPHADGSVYVVNPDPLLRDPINGMDAVVAKCGSVEEARAEARRLVAVAHSHRAGVPAPQGTYRQGLEDALRLAIPLATCSCADRIVEAIRKLANATKSLEEEYSRGIGEQENQDSGKAGKSV